MSNSQGRITELRKLIQEKRGVIKRAAASQFRLRGKELDAEATIRRAEAELLSLITIKVRR
jgi:hypothetical protein